MTHITLSKSTTSKPCLEFYSDGSGEARRVTIEHFPFRIGRAETADLRVESVEVSREHAEIFERNGYVARARLGQHQRHASQRQADQGDAALGRRHSESGRNGADIYRVGRVAIPTDGDAADSIEEVHRRAPNALPPEVAAIADDDRGHAVASDSDAAVGRHFAAAWRDRSLLLAASQSRRSSSRFSINRTRSASATGNSSGCERWSWRSSEPKPSVCFWRSERPKSKRRISCFPTSSMLQGMLPSGWELGITISLPTDVDILRFTEIYHEAQEHELRVAFDEFQGNGAQVLHLKSLLPDYLILAANMTKDLTIDAAAAAPLGIVAGRLRRVGDQARAAAQRTRHTRRALPGNRFRPGTVYRRSGRAHRSRRRRIELQLCCLDRVVAHNVT